MESYLEGPLFLSPLRSGPRQVSGIFWYEINFEKELVEKEKQREKLIILQKREDH